MSDVPLANKYSAETYDQALSNLVERWKQEGKEGSIKYDEAAIGMDKSTVSVALKFLGEIGLLEVPKAGNYIVPEEVFNYRTKMGGVKMDAMRQVESRLDEYPLYKETKFMLGLNDFVLDELAKEVSGSASVAASQDELSDVKRSLNILNVLGFLEIDEEGGVSIPDDLEGDTHTDPPEKNTGSEIGPDTESEDTEKAADTGGEVTVQQSPDGGTIARPESITSLTIDMDISMDVTEMDTDEVREKLEIVHDILGQNEE